MKKVLISLVAFLIAFSFVPVSYAKTIGSVPKATDHEKVTIHLFYASWCPHCHDFIKYFSDKYEDYADYFEIKGYMVSTLDSTGTSTVTIEENSNIMAEVIRYFKTDSEGNKLTGGIPLIIIGENFVQAGFGDDGSNVIEAALKEYESKKYKDVVANIIKDNKLETSKVESFKDTLKAYTAEDNTNTANADTKTSNKDLLIVVGVFVVLIAGFAGLVIVSKK